MKRAKNITVWSLLIRQGLFSDRKTAESWIMSGRVFVNDKRVDVSGELVSQDSQVRVKGLEQKYVGRGGLKLEGALSDFGIDVSDLVVLDTGASTGGFTDCLLQHGAMKVYAVDAGHGQLVGSLRLNSKVVNMERTNIADVIAQQLNPLPTLATVDLSYLSLTEAMPIIRNLLDYPGDMICLVKPLFEIQDPIVRRTGIIENPAQYIEVLNQLAMNVRKMKLGVRGVTHSHVTGRAGTREFFMWVSTSDSDHVTDIDEQIQQSVERVLLLD